MRKLLGILILVAPVLFADSAGGATARTPFPTDYQRSPCGSPDRVCQSFNQSQFAEIAGLRGFDIGQEWVDAHWDELMTAMRPTCERIATCFATPGNDHLFCNDIATKEATATCSSYPEGSVDREKCVFFTGVFMAGVDHGSLPVWTELQACAKEQQTAPAAERTLRYWITPETLDPDRTSKFTVYTMDSETGVAVQARLHIESKDPIYAEDSPNGLPTSFYVVEWKPRFLRVPNADGHRDLAAPQVRIEAPGYRAETFALPVTVPKMTLEMNPPAKKLKRGKNKVTIVARDAASGAPVEARVMGGTTILGKTNEPFELEITGGRPEIWVTSLYERYSDVVVAPAKK